MKNYRDNMEQDIMEAFTSMKSDRQIDMPDVEHELARLKADVYRRGTFAFRKAVAVAAAVLVVSGMALAAIANRHAIADFLAGTASEEAAAVEDARSDLVITPSASMEQESGEVVFPDADLAEVMTSICNTYRVQAVFRNEELKHMRLHFRYRTGESLEQVLRNLNMFDQIRVALNDGRIEVE